MDISGLTVCELESLGWRQRQVLDATQENIRVIIDRLAELRHAATKENDAPDLKIAEEVIDKE